MTTMTPIVVGITPDGVNNFRTLPPSFIVDGQLYLIHYTPMYESLAIGGFGTVENVDVIRNYDYHIKYTRDVDLDGTLFDNPCVTFQRTSKFAQYNDFLRFRSEVDSILHMPRVHFQRHTYNGTRGLPVATASIPASSKVVVKLNHGSRGGDQMLIPSNMLATVIKHGQYKTAAELAIMFPDVIMIAGENDDVNWLANPNDYVITEYVDNVNKEFRLLVSGDDIYIRERVITHGDYPQSNLNVEVYPSVSPVIYRNIYKSEIPKEVCDAVHDYVKWLKFPLGSIDLFHTVDDKWGMFEHAAQFAFHGAKLEFIRGLHTNAVHHIIQNFEHYRA